MLDLTFTSAVRNWVPRRQAVEFIGQWEAKTYRFYVTFDALRSLGEIGVSIEDSAEHIFDENKGIILPAAHRIWLAGDRGQSEFVINVSVLQSLREDHPGLFEQSGGNPEIGQN
ncbi:uncharacterized protein DUF1488 [Novosphingobium sp. PhB57]|jgi:hypothetical protein|uniref:DUF1488 family protein n=1 Tax=Novosphingobium sp. PhB57 TaxID=2485107 RepID=UPI001043E403|nr:DUF1488 family protein [Novosphingobium sp. PhB57]TCU51757.1 uncharacterized protein DUF1488 [Novosphingobium sp. PhB57]